MSKFEDIIAALERGDFVNANGRLVMSLSSEQLSSRVSNMLRHHNRTTMKRNADLVERLKRMKLRMEKSK